MSLVVVVVVRTTRARHYSTGKKGNYRYVINHSLAGARVPLGTRKCICIRVFIHKKDHTPKLAANVHRRPWHDDVAFARKNNRVMFARCRLRTLVKDILLKNIYWRRVYCYRAPQSLSDLILPVLAISMYTANIPRRCTCAPKRSRTVSTVRISSRDQSPVS